VDSGLQAAVAARIPGAAALGLVVPPSAAVVPAAVLADPDWTSEVLARRSRALGTREPRVLATVWWYSASTVVLAPALAGLATGCPLSARLAELSLCVRSDGVPVAAVATGAGGNPAADLRATVAAVVGVVAEAGRMRERPLWAIATDSIANLLLELGRALGDVPASTALAGALAAAVGAPLPLPRFVDVAGARFVRRASCCLLDRTPYGTLCTSCPRRPPVERRARLERAARWF
jgi:hypothetical protein